MVRVRGAGLRAETLDMRLVARVARGLAVIGGLALAGCGSGEKQAADAPAAAPASVGVVAVASRDVTPTVSFTGRVEAVDTVQLLARVAGFIAKVDFTEGADVKAGDLLFQLQKDQYQAQVLQAQGAVKQAEAALTDAQLQLDRGLQLVKNQNIPQSEVDLRKARRDKADGDLMGAEAQLETAQLDLGYTEITAPFDGRIGQKAFSVGAYVTPQSGPLATLVSQDPIYVTFPVTSRELLEVRKRAAETGQDARRFKVKLRLADGAVYDQTGTIDFVDVQVNQATDSVTVRAEFPNPKGTLIAGQVAGVLVEEAQPQQALVVPQAALLADQVGPYVLTVDGQGKVEQRRVKVGEGQGTDVVVQDGLKGGDRVIVDGLQRVRPGQAVQVAAEAAKPAGA
jgi:membrane fusion protein, multidrug efflux system